MTSPDVSSSPLPPEDAALEAELRQLRPQSIGSGLREAILEPLAGIPASSEELEGLARSLRRRIQASPAPAGLWDKIDARLAAAPVAPPAESAAPTKVVHIPKWRDFTPIFRVAAALAFGVFATAVWLQPTPDSNERSASRFPPAKLRSAIDNVPVPDSSKVVPVGRRGFIQGMESQGLLEKNNQMYEKYWQTRQDRSLYRLGDDLRVEDEVSREGPVITPLRTF